jgi:hypothetical protein
VGSYPTVSPPTAPGRSPGGGLLSVALARGSRRVAVNNSPTLRSPDVPRHPARGDAATVGSQRIVERPAPVSWALHDSMDGPGLGSTTESCSKWRGACSTVAFSVHGGGRMAAGGSHLCRGELTSRLRSCRELSDRLPSGLANELVAFGNGLVARPRQTPVVGL